MFGAQANSNYFNSYSSLEPDTAVRMNGDGRTLSAPDIARNTMRGAGSNSNTLSSAARRRMEDRMFTRKVCSQNALRSFLHMNFEAKVFANF